MGQKTNALGFRLQVNKNWKSRWYADTDVYADRVLEDVRIRRLLEKELKTSGIVKIEIERTNKQITINMHVARPGVVIGKGGKRVEEVKKRLQGIISDKVKLRFDVKQIRKSEISARLLGEEIARQLEQRGSYKRVMNKATENAMGNPRVAGIQIALSGRLNGVPIARTEKKASGSVPMQTIMADIQYHQAEAQTKYGLIGVKVWLHKVDPEEFGDRG